MSLDFMGAIAANMSMKGDPDWIIKIGDYIVRECVEWEFTDDEKDQSQIRVLLPNPLMNLASRFKIGMDMTIRFGYANEMSPEAFLPVAEINTEYPSDKNMVVEVIGRDESSKMSGGNNKGNQGKGDDAKQLRKTIEANGLKMSGEAKGGDSGCKGACYNESDKALAYRWANAMASQGAANTESGGNEPVSPFDGGSDGAAGAGGAENPGYQRHNGYTTSTSGDWGGDGKGGKDRAKNRQGNKSGQNSQATITANFKLRGFPTLRAKANVTIAGVEECDVGTYYVKKVKHEWKGKGFLSIADLTRGGTGKGGVGGKAPMVMYANIWKRGEIYCGPRKTDGQGQATFVYGQDEHWMGLKVKNHPQPQSGGGEPKKGKAEGIALRKRLEAMSTSEDSNTSGGTGQ